MDDPQIEAFVRKNIENQYGLKCQIRSDGYTFKGNKTSIKKFALDLITWDESFSFNGEDIVLDECETDNLGLYFS